MRWLKRDLWRIGIPLTGLLFLLLLIILIPLSASAHSGTPRVAIAETVQPTPTVDLTVTALAKDQLALQVRQLQHQLQDQNNWFANNSTALIAAFASVIIALFGIFQWAITVRQTQDKELRDRAEAREKERVTQEKELKDRQETQDKELKDRREAQDKELRAQAEERFKTAVAALGSENEAIQVGGAILLRSFLNPADKDIYEHYYTQIFDLAVAYLRLPRSSHPPEDSNTPMTPTTLSQALTVVFKEAFPLARNKVGVVRPLDTVDNIDIARNVGEAIQSLDATGVQLDNAYLALADLKHVWMRNAFLRNAELSGADLSGALLHEANLSGAILRQANLSGVILRKANLSDGRLSKANLSGAILSGANLRGAHLRKTNLSGARLREVDLSNAYLREADLSDAYLHKADLSGTHLEDALSLKKANLSGVKGLTKEQLLACKAKGAIIDEDTLNNAPPATVSSSLPLESNGAQAPSAMSVQRSISMADAGKGNPLSSQQSSDTRPQSVLFTQVNKQPSDTGEDEDASFSQPSEEL